MPREGGVEGRGIPYGAPVPQPCTEFAEVVVIAWEAPRLSSLARHIPDGGHVYHSVCRQANAPLQRVAGAEGNEGDAGSFGTQCRHEHGRSWSPCVPIACHVLPGMPRLSPLGCHPRGGGGVSPRRESVPWVNFDLFLAAVLISRRLAS